MSTIARPVVFADVLPVPGTKLKAAVLVAAFALLTALLAQVRVPLGFTPVPVTGQTLGVLLAGAVLGSRLGAASIVLYVLMGLFLPVYTGGKEGWVYASGATGGYLVGMIVAAFLVGKLAERMQDRTFLTSIPAMLFGSAVVYAFGAPWLAHVLNVGAADAVAKGVAPFIVGDAIKTLIAGALLPVAWKLARTDSQRD